MNQFFIISSAFFIIINIWLLIHMRVAFGGGLWQLLYVIFFLAMYACFITPMLMPDLRFATMALRFGYIWMGFLLISLFWFGSYDILRFVSFIFDYLSKKNTGNILRASRAVPVLLVWCSLLLAYGLYSAENIEVKNLTLETSAPIDNDEHKLRIVAVTDIHLSPDRRADKLRGIIDLINEQKPDVVAIVGDLVDTNMKDRQEDAALMREINAPKGKLAVLGNHEFYRGINNSINFIEKSDLHLLRGEIVVVDGIQIAGIDDPMNHSRIMPSKILDQLNPNLYTVLLSHRPEIDPAAVGFFDLQLSGHTHGGQIWPGFITTYMEFGFSQDLSTITAKHPKAKGGNKDSLLFLSNGVGYWGPPVRLFARPDIVVIDIVQQKPIKQ